ncbi:MAG: right-handed parallel beta-helix repeat-containing protein [Candidatus Falkowbacteria bacterium]
MKSNKLIVGIFVACLVLLSSFNLLAKSHSVEAAAKAGDLIKAAGTSAVYYLDSSNKKHLFVNDKVFYTWYSDYSQVVTISATEFNKYAVGPHVAIRPGTKLLKGSKSTVYAVERKGTLRPIVSASEASRLYGADWASRVLVADYNFFRDYKIGTSISSTQYAVGTIISDTTSGNYYYYDGAKFRKIISADAFYANNFKSEYNVSMALSPGTVMLGADITGYEAGLAEIATIGLSPTSAATCFGSTTQSCKFANGSGLQTRVCANTTWTAWSACAFNYCSTGYTYNGTICTKTCTGSATATCAFTNGTGTQTRICTNAIWSAYGACTYNTCNAGYTYNGTTCAPTVCSGETSQTCAIANGAGVQVRACTSGAWSDWTTCIITTCNSGYQDNGSGTCALIGVTSTTTPPVITPATTTPPVITTDATKPIITNFIIPSASSALSISITNFSATDNVGVTGYLLTESSVIPSTTNSAWISSAPIAYTFSTAGSKTLYAWVKDSAGNVSNYISASIIVTLNGGTTYYVSFSSGSDSNNGTSVSTPWKTIAKVNSQTFKAGDFILFKKGDTWVNEAIIVKSSGSAAAPITYSSYGSGSKPLISGQTTVTGWVSEGNGIYSKTISAQSVPNMVTIDDSQQAMGRYPDAGTWLYFESHVGTNSITDAELPSSPNWNGAEIVTRKTDWGTYRNKITSHVGQTLTFTDDASPNALPDKFGYFIENSLATLTQYGEWYYDATSTKFYMYFGTVDPSTKIVKVSTVDRLITGSSGVGYWSIDGLALIGANKDAVYLGSNNNISLKNLNVDFSGNDGIWAYYSDNIIIDNIVVAHTNDVGIYSTSYSDNVSITNCNVDGTELIFGQGRGGFSSGTGIFSFQGTNLLVANNVITNSGYNGINMAGDNQIVRNNFIQNYCLMKTDCGGVYTGMQTAYHNMTIDSNILVNGVGGVGGEPAGTAEGGARGIYIDFNTTGGVAITNNTVSSCSNAGIFDHMSNNLTISGNTVYNCKRALGFQETDNLSGAINNLIVANNIFFAKTASQLTFYSRLNPGKTYVGIGTFSNNYYARPVDDITSIKALVSIWDGTAINLSGWQTLSGQDTNSHKSPVTLTDTNNILFDYNASVLNKVISLGASTYVDMAGATHTGSVTLLPYTSIILLKTN